MIGDYKEVFFDVYCPQCKHYRKPEKLNPCDECLDTPAVVDSHKPINFEQNKGNNGDKDGKKKCPCGCK